MARQFKLKEAILACPKVASGVITTDTNGMCPSRLWQIGFHYPVLHVPARIFSPCLHLRLVLEGGVAEDFAVADGDKIKRKEVKENAVWKRFW
jgi:hypothetical protein